jgi:dipeptidyl aminopeptidase/acylaminoacyl peptidase
VEGNDDTFQASISADGRFVAFSTWATNFARVDGQEVYLRDRLLGTTELVSRSTGGAHGNGGSMMSALSADGRYVAFASGASNFVGGDANGTWDVFVRDRTLGTTERVSVSTSGVEGDRDVGPGPRDLRGRTLRRVRERGLEPRRRTLVRLRAGLRPRPDRGHDAVRECRDRRSPGQLPDRRRPRDLGRRPLRRVSRARPRTSSRATRTDGRTSSSATSTRTVVALLCEPGAAG